MPRLPRPYIPLSIRVEVIRRQLVDAGLVQTVPIPQNRGAWIEKKLRRLFGDRKVELHHRPALVNRVRKPNGDYDPAANNPDFLVYLPEDEHDIETRVRGQHGQHSDLALARKRKRKERKAQRPKRKWGSPPLRSASRWPKGRKIENRRKP